jgi:hypothetical protein
VFQPEGYRSNAQVLRRTSQGSEGNEGAEQGQRHRFKSGGAIKT